MASPTPRLPLELGRLVRRRTDPGDTPGLIVGLIFERSIVALVRWRRDGSTFEPLNGLIDVHGVEL